MEYLLIFLSYLFTFIFWQEIKKLRQNLTDQSKKISELEARLEGRSLPIFVEKRVLKEKPEIKPVVLEEKYKEKGETKPVIIIQTSPEKSPSPPPVKFSNTQTQSDKASSSSPIKIFTTASEPAVEPLDENSFLRKIEKQISQNWTGILGAVILVLGVAFFALAAFLVAPPFVRFIIIIGFAGGLFVLHRWLAKKPDWISFSGWMKSSSLAIALFGCTGSGYISGLKWIENEYLAVLILLVGVIINIYSGYLSKNEVYFSLHSVLSLAALSVENKGIVILIVGSLVTIFCLSTFRREKWDWHILVTNASYFIFHLLWVENASSGFDEDIYLRFAGAILCLSVNSTGLYSHYRDIYKSNKLEILPFFTHLSSWIFTGFGLLAYSTGSKWTVIPIYLAAGIVFFLAKGAKRKEISWLYRTDTLVSLTLFLIATLALSKWKLDSIVIASIVYFEFAIFLIIESKEDDDFLKKLSVVFHFFCLLGFVILGFPSLIKSGLTKEIILSRTLNILVVFVFELFVVKYFSERGGEPSIWKTLVANEKDANLLPGSGIFLPFLCLLIYLYISEYFWSGIVFVSILSFLIVIREKWKVFGILIGNIIIIPGFTIYTWLKVGGTTDYNFLEKFIYLSPILILPYFWAKYSEIEEWKFNLSDPSIYYTGLHLTISGYILLNGFSVLIPGAYFAVLSVAFLESANFKSEKLSRNSFIITGFLILVAFVVRHILSHLQAEAILLGLSARLWLGLLGIVVLLHWCFFTKRENWEEKISPFFWEGVFGFSFFVLVAESSSAFLPLGYMAFGIIAYLLSRVKFLELERMYFISILFHWITCFHIAFISSTNDSPQVYWEDPKWIIGLIAIGVQLLYIFFIYTVPPKESSTYPSSLRFFKWMFSVVNLHRFSAIYYPFFVSIFLFLFWSFDSSILTLAWTVEAVGIFVLSVIIKEKYFRYISNALLVFCVGRLIFYDMAKADVLLRAFLFLGVGVALLGVNSIYNKYKDRFLS